MKSIIIKPLPAVNERPPLFIIGDVHGCALELEELIIKARQKISDCQIVLVGDLFTKGPDPVGVYDLIKNYQALCVKGNHDWALISAIIHSKKKGNEHLAHHTQQTLYRIRHHSKAFLHYMNQLPHALVGNVKPLKTRLQWEAEYGLHIVHAGINPLIGLENSSERVLLTARWFKWDMTVTPKQLLLVSLNSRQENNEKLGESDSCRPYENKVRWHSLYQGPALIVFGHDAKQGLFRKTLPNGRPLCVGLDTGCTYGGSLTGYFPDYDDVLQVEAKSVYFNMEQNKIVKIIPKE